MPDACTLTTLYADRDGDGHGAGTPTLRCPAAGSTTLRDDCDDDDASRYPGADEVCNGIDDDCDEALDEGIQRLLGEPVLLAADAVPRWHDVANVGNSYVVAWNTAAGVRVRRFDRAGAPLSSEAMVTPELDVGIRVLSRDIANGILIVEGDRDLTARTLMVGGDTILVGAPTTIAQSGGLAFFGAAWRGSTLDVVSSDGTSVVGQSFDALFRLTSAAVPYAYPRDAARALLPGSPGPLLLMARGTDLVAVELAADLTVRGEDSLPVGDAIPFLSAIDRRGRVSVLAGEGAGLAVVSFDRAGISSDEPLNLQTSPIPLVRPFATGFPGLVAHDAGVDVAVHVADGAGATMELTFLARDGTMTSGAIAATYEETSLARGARLSSREGAWVYLARAGGLTELRMQRVGCE